MASDNEKRLKASEVLVLVIFAIIIVSAIFIKIFQKEKPPINNQNFDNEKFVDSIINSPLFAKINEMTTQKIQELQNSNLNNSANLNSNSQREILLNSKITNQQSGFVSFSRQADRINLKIQANLPALLSGYFYSVWLRGDKDFLLKIGRLQNNNNSIYTLDYSTTGDLSAATDIIVAIENQADNLSQIEEVLIGKF